MIRCPKNAQLIVEECVHIATRSGMGADGCLIQLKEESTLHFAGRATIHSDSRLVLGKGATVEIGNGCVFRDRFWLRAVRQITIGDGTIVGHQTMIMDSDIHLIIADGEVLPNCAPVHVGSHVWVGARSMILKGVTIGEGSVIGAGSLVTRDIPEKVLAYGRPVTVQRRIDHWQPHEEVG